MTVLLSIVTGLLYAAGIYMMLRRSMVKLIIGLGLLGHATNLLIFTVGGLLRGAVPIVPLGQTTPTTPITDPLPQALILTAIVIGFGVQAFAIVLLKRTWQSTGSEDVDDLTATDRE